MPPMKYWEIVADKLSAARLVLGYCSAVTRDGWRRVLAGSKAYWTKVLYTAVGSAAESARDYVFRRFNASSAGLKKPVGLDLRWKAA
jgi:hypothetical protein